MTKPTPDLIQTVTIPTPELSEALNRGLEQLSDKDKNRVLNDCSIQSSELRDIIEEYKRLMK
jgi:hypothetical protein